MTSEPPSSSEQPTPLPKATMPVELAPPAEKPAAETGPSGLPAAIEMGEPADLPAQEETQAADPAAPQVDVAAKPGFRGWFGSLSLAEKLSCGAILAAIVIFSALVFVPALFDFPDQPVRMSSDDFPLMGSKVEVRSAETYWREPVLEGEGAEAVRAGTVLIPVLDAKLEGKGRVQVIFRNGQGELAGDPVTIEFEGSKDASAAATAGFTERGDFTAYQAGQTESWFIEFHEVPEGAEGIGEKTMLFKMNISPTLK